jgi:hypothetical protein
MPLLKIVAACEKVIFDQDGPTSLISLFESMKYQLQEAPLPERAVLPNQWCVFTQWENIPSEVGQVFTQVVRIFAPDGTLFSESEHPFMNADPQQVQMRIRLLCRALPVWQEGRVDIKVSLKGNDEVLGTAAFRIIYLPKEENAKAIAAPIPQP